MYRNLRESSLCYSIVFIVEITPRSQIFFFFQWYYPRRPITIAIYLELMQYVCFLHPYQVTSHPYSLYTFY